MENTDPVASIASHVVRPFFISKSRASVSSCIVFIYSFDLVCDKPHSCELCHKKFALACNLRAHMKTHESDSQEECMGCGKTYLAFSTPLNGKNFCRSCSNDASTPNQTTFPTEKFSSYTDSGSDESYVTENEDNEEAHSEK
ncbi:hypothetical protein PGB90_006308 [Kerria lacca]